MEVMTTHYTRSTGERAEIKRMPTPHLKAAHAKLLQENAWMGQRSVEIDALAAEIARRGDEWPGGL